jgi:hypothetical protein
LSYSSGSSALLNNRYERKEKLGDGSYGIVYKCWDRDSEQALIS